MFWFHMMSSLILYDNCFIGLLRHVSFMDANSHFVIHSICSPCMYSFCAFEIVTKGVNKD